MGIIVKLKQYQFSDAFIVTASTIILIPFVLFLRLVGGTWLASNHHFPSLVQSLVIATILIGLWLIHKIILRKGLALSGIEINLLPFLSIIILSTVFSKNISLSAEKALGAGVYFILALIILEVRKKVKVWEGLVNSLLLTALFTTTVSLFSVFHAFRVFDYGFLDFVSRPFNVVRSLPRLPDIKNLHATISAGYYLMVFPLAIYRFNKTKNQIIKIILTLGGLLSLGVFFLIQSRGSMIGLALLFVCALYQSRQQILDLARRYRIFAITIASVILLVIGLGFGYILARRGLSLTGESILCRLQAWKVSIEILRQNPLLGSGMETFGYRFLDIRQSEVCSSILHVTHNDLLQILVNFGLSGLAALIFFFWKFRKKIQMDQAGENESSKYALPALAGLLGMGLMTTMVYSPNIRFLLIFYLAWMVPLDKIQYRVLQPGWVVGLIAMMVVLAGGSGWMLWKIHPYYQARLAADGGNFAQAEIKLEDAYKRDPGIVYYNQALAFIKAQHYCTMDLDLDGAVNQYWQTLDQVTIHPADHANLAGLLASQAAFEDAVTEMEIAIELNLQNHDYQCLLGGYYLELGDNQAAFDALAECVAGDQKWLDTLYWDTLDLTIEMEDRILALAVDRIDRDEAADKNLTWGKLFYYGGDLLIAREYFDQQIVENPKDYHAMSYLAQISLREGSPYDAAEYSLRALDLQPRCQICWLVQAEIALENGDLPGAELALDISNYLRVTPRAQVLLARLYLEKGDQQRAIDSLRSAAVYLSPQDRYSHWVSSRWSFETSHLKCLPLGLTYQDYYLPVVEGGAILQEISDEELISYYEDAKKPDRISRDFIQAEFEQYISDQ